jgi:hypothetical protein
MPDIFRIVKVYPLDCRVVNPSTVQYEELTGDGKEYDVNC